MEYRAFINPFEEPRKGYYYASCLDETVSDPSSQKSCVKILNQLFGGISLEYCEFVAHRIALNENWEDSTSIYPAIEASLLGLRDVLGFAFPHPGEVVDYIIQNPGLYDVVMYTCSMTAEEFGRTSEITLDIYHDPESDDHYLTIYVRQERYDEDIIARMDKICDKYEPALRGQSGWLLLTTDFKSPIP